MKITKQVMQKCLLMGIILSLTFSLAGCGSEGGGSAEQTKKSNDVMGIAQDAETDSYTAGESADDMEAEDNGESVASESKDQSEETAGSQETKDQQTAQQQKVSKEMLVFRGTLMIDTLDFERSVTKFREMLNAVGGFVEKENYSDDGGLGDYYIVEEEDKHNTYTATIRVPSSEYDQLMNTAGDLGDVRSKSSNAQNVTQQYGTYQSQIKIYEAEYERYLKLLEKASEDEYAMQIEQKLFELQLKIAEIKSGITNIETDVAYSYIDVTLKEVKEYQEDPEEKEDTFLNRLKEVCADSWDVFLTLLEGILFTLIYTWYYIVFILLVVFVILKYVRKKPDAETTYLGAPKEENEEPVEPEISEEEEDSTEVEQGDEK